LDDGISLKDETEFVPPVETSSRKKILTCDDEKNIVRLIQVNLEREGYEVVTAYNGRECLDMVASEHPDLIVLDLMMPEMTGFEVLDHLKGDPETADIPVIMLTARTQDQDVLRGWQAGVECYLTKPFMPGELITFIKRIFSVSEEEDPDEQERWEL
jgi:two-component system alkaline phosphatase synthesis response regulator PhoP/two-component system response regulator VicR